MKPGGGGELYVPGGAIGGAFPGAICSANLHTYGRESRQSETDHMPPQAASVKTQLWPVFSWKASSQRVYCTGPLSDQVKVPGMAWSESPIHAVSEPRAVSSPPTSMASECSHILWKLARKPPILRHASSACCHVSGEERYNSYLYSRVETVAASGEAGPGGGSGGEAGYCGGAGGLGGAGEGYKPGEAPGEGKGGTGARGDGALP